MPFKPSVSKITDILHVWVRLSKAPASVQFKIRGLLDEVGSPMSLLGPELDKSSLRSRIEPELFQFLVDRLPRIPIGEDVNIITRLKVGVVGWGDTRYPLFLRNIHQPPLVMYVRGELAQEDACGVALVGTRHATTYGKMVARKLARGLAGEGVTVVSGLARGIDTAAHEGALEAGGRTIAVLGSGVDIIYPGENRSLAESIEREGCGAVVSELPIGSKPLPGNFPRRNRIISGLSKGVVVVEAPLKSGALITARFALEQGREVFAVPGSINSPYSRGVHMLIRDGAKLVENVEDILEELSLPRVSARGHTETAANLTLSEQSVLGVLSEETMHIDAIGYSCGLPPAETADALMRLQLRGKVRELPGKLFCREV